MLDSLVNQILDLIIKYSMLINEVMFSRPETKLLSISGLLSRCPVIELIVLSTAAVDIIESGDVASKVFKQCEVGVA